MSMCLFIKKRCNFIKITKTITFYFSIHNQERCVCVKKIYDEVSDIKIEQSKKREFFVRILLLTDPAS
jgi:hypothetical protein